MATALRDDGMRDDGRASGDPRQLDTPTTSERPPGWWGMVGLIMTEASLFTFLLFSYYYLGSLSPQWPPVARPELTLSGPNTMILLASSGTMWWGEAGIRRGSRGRLISGLVLTFILGAVFLSIQMIEYHKTKFLPQSHAYGSVFYTITGFHGAHVAIGLLMVLFVLARALCGHFTPARHLAIKNAAMYWHFVDIVWLFVFITIYITPRFWWHQ
ncbi:MAG: heme-copper oxidase subunit III [Gemmatimonadaceae bacterium]|nr:heme-copper oxidase subunit III [Gemmatimonadaceae bacterium]